MHKAEFTRPETELTSKGKADSEKLEMVQVKAASDENTNTDIEVVANAQTNTEVSVRPTAIPSPSLYDLKAVKKAQFDIGATQRMRNLNTLYTEGLITQEEFDAKKREILEAM